HAGGCAPSALHPPCQPPTAPSPNVPCVAPHSAAGSCVQTRPPTPHAPPQGAARPVLGAVREDPPMSPMWPLVLGAGLAGLVGSPHCVGMCGGFATACATPTRHAVAWHAGRLVTYGVLGA